MPACESARRPSSSLITGVFSFNDLPVMINALDPPSSETTFRSELRLPNRVINMLVNSVISSSHSALCISLALPVEHILRR